MQEIQSYVLTTAILARRIDDRLGERLKSESVAPHFGRQLDFRQLIDLFIHYCRFEPDIYSTTLSDSEVPQKEFFFRVYSERIKDKHDAGSLLAIRLADYFAIIEKIASDDVFVLRHLLAATITRLMRASHASGQADPDDLSEVVASVDDVIWLSRELANTMNLPLRDVPLHAPDIKFKHRGPAAMGVDTCLVHSGLYPTLGLLVDGYKTAWRHTPLLPSKIGEEYCLFIEIPDPDFRPMALPFPKLADTFVEVQKRLPNP